MKRIIMGWAAAVALAWAGAASAGTVGFEFEGVVTYATDLAPVGTRVQGRFAWDADAAPLSTPIPQIAFYGAPAVLPLTVSVGPHTIVAYDVHVTMFNDLGGNAEDMIDIGGIAPAVDGTTYPNGSFGIRLASGPGSTDVFQDLSLPRHPWLKDFDSQGLNSVQLRVDGSSNGVVLDIRIDKLSRHAPQR
ncbi:hypothetical protein ACPWT1_06055 [Ramlibacter sp. MMS24-I3-19]|uniref:hypothetical protein n=1 Tax=Ramlibacter sp. MMS24-I3-19 TaxID=3416606 RepID=UPI003D068EDA